MQYILCHRAYKILVQVFNFKKDNDNFILLGIFLFKFFLAWKFKKSNKNSFNFQNLLVVYVCSERNFLIQSNRFNCVSKSHKKISDLYIWFYERSLSASMCYTYLVISSWIHFLLLLSNLLDGKFSIHFCFISLVDLLVHLMLENGTYLAERMIGWWYEHLVFSMINGDGLLGPRNYLLAVNPNL